MNPKERIYIKTSSGAEKELLSLQKQMKWIDRLFITLLCLVPFIVYLMAVAKGLIHVK